MNLENACSFLMPSLIKSFIKTRAKTYSVTASAKMCEAYKAYFSMPTRDQDKPLGTSFYLQALQERTLGGWYRREKRAIKFAIPRIWCEPTTTQAIATSAWWTLPNVGLTRMHLLSCIQTFHHPLHQCYTALSSL
ncbi:uncharacterized protein LOC143256659 [Tachypleus tridentatus]|uniref:uncharacterized protein LOC143256659 n=1 Tax=Tachypleus tridentatus TaxID=6853 RepID=UPI003FD59837